jgi:hypothetical protein
VPRCVHHFCFCESKNESNESKHEIKNDYNYFEGLQREGFARGRIYRVQVRALFIFCEGKNESKNLWKNESKIL